MESYLLRQNVLSESEREYAEKLINLCAKIINVALDKKLR